MMVPLNGSPGFTHKVALRPVPVRCLRARAGESDVLDIFRNALEAKPTEAVPSKDEVAPASDAPGMPAPETAPEAVSVPELELPEVKMPELKVPEVEVPQLSVPEVPAKVESKGFKMPELKLPEMKKPEPKVPEVKASEPEPKLPEVDMGVTETAAKAETEDVKMPELELPDNAKPEANLPDIEVPEASIPDVVAKPEPQGFKMPEFKLPEMKKPDLKLPEVEAPEANMPAAAPKPEPQGFKMPELKMPEMKKPELKLPEVEAPEANMPEATPKPEPQGFKMPELKMPEMKKPEIKLPEVEVPEASVPEPAAKPEPQGLKMPEIKLPEIKQPEPKLPEPKLPEVKLPEVNAPSMPAAATDVTKIEEAAQSLATESSAPIPTAEVPVQAIPEAASQAAAAVQEPGALTKAMEYVDDMFDRTEGAVGNFIESTSGTVAQTIEKGSQAAERFVTQSAPSLPPKLQAKADIIAGNFAQAKAIYDDAPGVYLLLMAIAIGSVSYSYYKFEYGGFKGILTPVDLLEALNREENILVVDIRPDEELEKGVLDLKRNARGKATHLPLVDVPDAVKGDIDNKQRLQLQLNAALVCSLNEVNKFTKIVLMDSRGGSVKELARTVTSQGYRGYMLKGGYNLWKTSGLATKKGSYVVTPADLLADKGEEWTEAAEQTAAELQQPRNAAIVLLTLAAVTTVVAYPHETFRYLGVLGIELTILVKLLSYDNPQAAVEDLNKSLGAVADSVSSAGKQIAGGARAAAASTSQGSKSSVADTRQSAAAAAVKDVQAALGLDKAESAPSKSDESNTSDVPRAVVDVVSPPNPPGSRKKKGPDGAKPAPKQ